MSWHVIIHQIAESGEKQEYEHDARDRVLGWAIMAALDHHHLRDCEVGEYQITVTPRLAGEGSTESRPETASSSSTSPSPAEDDDGPDDPRGYVDLYL